jgi:glycerol-3-phosphate cytidylyltransferase-like family protein
MMNIWVVGIFDLFCVSDINTFNKIKQKYPNSCIKVGIFDDNDLKNKSNK